MLTWMYGGIALFFTFSIHDYSNIFNLHNTCPGMELLIFRVNL